MCPLSAEVRPDRGWVSAAEICLTLLKRQTYQPVEPDHGDVEPITILLTAVQGAKTAAQASQRVDEYAKKYGLSREEALKGLAREAYARGDLKIRDFADDYRAHLAWKRAHPIAALTLQTVDPLGIYGAASRSAKRWSKTRPS